MKNTTLLKVLSATAIFSAVAAIEAYDQDNFAFAADETPVVTNTTTTPATNSSNNTKPTTTTATPTANSTTAPKADEPATVPQDVKALKDGEYKITAEAINFGNGKNPSMAAAGLDNEKTKLIVKNGQYSVSVTFKPIAFAGQFGYLGDLKYYDGDKTHKNRFEIDDSEFKDTTIVENYGTNETDKFVEKYKEKFPNRTVYPKTFIYSVDKNKIDDNNKLETYTQVFVPVMESMTAGSGTQNMILKFDLSKVKVNQPTDVSPQPKPTDSTGTTSNSNTSNNSESTTPKPTEPTTKPAETPKPAPTTPVETKPSSSASATYYNGVTATLLNAHRPGQRSMEMQL